MDRRAGLAVALTLLGSGCVRGCTSSQPPIHLQRNMYHQPKYKAQDSSDFFYDGATMRQPIPGTVARGELHEDRARFDGLDAAGQPVATSPVPASEALLARGAERYHIYCAPCHDERGDGKGILFQRGNVPTATMHSDKLRTATDGFLFGVITNGSGLMPSYRWPINPDDRWAIIAYVRQLQQKRQQDTAGAAHP